MDQLGIDIHVLTIPAPGADRFEAGDAARLARIANDAVAAICQEYPKRFIGFFTLPTSSIRDSVDELERSNNELGLRGFGCFANLNGKPLDQKSCFQSMNGWHNTNSPVLHPSHRSVSYRGHRNRYHAHPDLRLGF